MDAATTIVNAKVFDGTKSQDWTSVRFADGLITKCSAASAAQEGDEVIDAGGGTVLPGLIDAHVHLVPGALAQSLSGAASARRRPWPLPRPNRHEYSDSPTEDVSPPGSARTWSSCPVTR